MCMECTAMYGVYGWFPYQYHLHDGCHHKEQEYRSEYFIEITFNLKVFKIKFKKSFN